MRYCLAKDGRAVEGDSASELVSQVTDYSIDYEKRTVFIDLLGRDDSISYSKAYSDEELRAEVAKRILQILVNNGWRLYQSRD